jgi:hypothetical protein
MSSVAPANAWPAKPAIWLPEGSYTRARKAKPGEAVLRLRVSDPLCGAAKL